LKPGFIEAERLVLEGDLTGARQIVEDICKEDSQYNAAKDRFVLYVVEKIAEKDVLIKKNKTKTHEEKLQDWYKLFKNVDSI
jgi:hypothetical protein